MTAMKALQYGALVFMTLLPAALSVVLYLAERRAWIKKISSPTKQVGIGVLFGLIAVLATETGIPVNGTILNVRNAAPLTAGLLFGGPAGIIAGAYTVGLLPTGAQAYSASWHAPLAPLRQD